MPEAAGAGAAAPDPTIAAVPGWAQELLDAGVEPEMVHAAVARQAAEQAAAGLPSEAEVRGQAAASRREQAQADYDAAMATVAATREHADSLRESADAMEAQAGADRDAALAAADDLDPEV